MLTAIEIENFKAFGERQRIELRPITLLFGPNSGGKSSVTNALHYLNNILIGGQVDVHHTRFGGEAVDLGGIRNFVHGQRLGKPIRFRVEFDLSGVLLSDYPFDRRDPILENEEEKIRGAISSGAVELQIDTAGEPALTSLRVCLNGEPLATLVMNRGVPHAEIRDINWLNPVLMMDDDDRHVAKLLREMEQVSRKEDGVDSPAVRAAIEELRKEKEKFESHSMPGALAALFEDAGGTIAEGVVLQVRRTWETLPDLDNQLDIQFEGRNNELDADTQDFQEESALMFERLMSMLLLGPVRALTWKIADTRYVGPLRAMPVRHHETSRAGQLMRWWNGIAAWEILRDGDDELFAETSACLGREDRLDTGYEIERMQYKEIPAGTAIQVLSPQYEDLREDVANEIQSLPTRTRVVLHDVARNLRFQPQDVGVGLSQVVPIVVALLSEGTSLVMLEQPELHLHPRQQAAMGDVLIRGLERHPDCVHLVETHSEHLILRLLRRIRETTRQQALPEHQLQPAQLRVLYVHKEGSTSTVQTIEVDVNGDLVDPWPDDFFEQDFKERFS